ncbi:MAG: hypothetical protein RIG62_09135 [Cyclobacteriaceae bacterium]
MQFPMLNITDTQWRAEYDVSIYVLFDEFIYTDDDKLFSTYFQDKFFCDTHGQIYRVIGKRPPQQIWRRVFSFLPNVYKVTLLFKDTGEKMPLESVRHFMLTQMQNLRHQSDDESLPDWITQVEKAKPFQGILHGETH